MRAVKIAARINFFDFWCGWIFKVEVCLGSRLLFYTSTVLTMVCTDYWMSQVRITDIIHKHVYGSAGGGGGII